METIMVYHCALCESVQEVTSGKKPTFSVYKTDDGKDIAICPRCKSVIVGVFEEMYKSKKKK